MDKLFVDPMTKETTEAIVSIQILELIKYSLMVLNLFHIFIYFINDEIYKIFIPRK